MKPQQTARLLATVAPAAAAAPLLALAGLGAGLLWLLFREKKPEQNPADTETQSPKPGNVGEPKVSAPPVSAPISPVSAVPMPRPAPARLQTVKRVTREDLAEALAYGARKFTRKEAVEELETLGFRKTAAYKALSADGKFAALIEFTSDGLIEWNG